MAVTISDIKIGTIISFSKNWLTDPLITTYFSNGHLPDELLTDYHQLTSQ